MDEIEEFLRRALQGQAGQRKRPPTPRPRPPQGQTPAQQPPSQRPPAQQPPAQATPPNRARPASPILDAELVSDAEMQILEGEVVHSSIGRGSSRRLSTDDIKAHVDALGDHIENADERMEAHLHEIFSHRLGSLGDSGGGPQQAPTGDDESSQSRKKRRPSIAQTLSNPKTLRAAMIASVVLTRPNWDE